MADEYSDILGADTLPIGPKRAGSWSSLSFTVKSAFVLSFLLVSYVVSIRLWDAFWKWRDREYKLSMRRKYGIPDNDHRPFNVAYAAAQLAREQEDQQKVKKRRAVQVPAQVSSAREQRDHMSEQVRQRPASQYSTNSTAFPGSLSNDSLYNIPGGISSHSNMQNDNHHPSNRVTFADGYNTSASPLEGHAELAPMAPSTRRVSDRKTLGILKSSNNYINDDHRKRAFGTDDLDHFDNQMDTKKTRVEGEDFIDGDEEPGWQDEPYGRSSAYTRGSKRGLDGADARGWDKRQRKVSADKNYGMEVDEEPDALGDLVNISPSRGRKRDRAEAGSSFGGDEEEENIALDGDVHSRSRHRKRRNKRTSDAYSGRSRKRDRDLDDVDEYSDSHEGSPGPNSRHESKKKGKKNRRNEEERGSDVSMDESQFVRSTIKGRKIGEAWTSNGIKYKIGPNGQRLREALLKKAKQRFVMPEDSVHPDRSAFHDVYIEAWVTDEEYQNFATQGILYEPPKEPETPSSAIVSKSAPTASKGKHLLWESTTTHSSTPPPVNPFETAGKTSDSGPSNALVRSESLGAFARNGRIASAFRGSATSDSMSGPPSPSLSESSFSLASPRTGRYRQYSKWEKQDLEAKAMSRMRDANNKKKEEEERLEREKQEKEAKAKAAIAPPPTIPTISFTKPPEEQGKPEAPKSSALPLFSSNSSPSISITPSNPSAPKLSFGPTPPPATTNPAAAPSDNKPKAPSPLSFSFAPTPSTTAPPSAPAASAAPPSFSFAQPGKQQEGAKSLGLGFPSSAGSSSTAAPSANIAAPTNNATPAPSPAPAGSTTSAPKFNFGVPSKPAASFGAEPNKQTAPTTSSNGSTNPLLTRLSPAGSSADGPSKPQPTPLQLPQSSAPTTASAPVFSFAKPSTTPSSFPAPAPASAFNAPTTQKQPEQTTNSLAGTSTPKFDFGSTLKGPATGSSTSQNGDSKPNAAESRPSFGFGQPQDKGSATSNSTTGTPNLSLGGVKPASFAGFGNTSAPSPFGANPSSTANSFGGSGNTSANPFGTSNAPKDVNSTSSTSEAPKATSIFGGNSGGSAFGNNGNVTSSFSFGPKAPAAPTHSTSSPSLLTTNSFSSTGATPSPFGSFGSLGGSSTNAFGSNPSKPGEPKPFGTSTSASADKSDGAAKSLFSFGATSTPASSPAAAKPATATGNVFGGSSGGGTFSFGGSTTPAASPFGGGPASGVFGGGNTNTTSSSASGPFSFGNASQSK
ncbi:hypothetical protein PM082_005828 [Marasmius tenuissimus]|nr:hypothetical protein PM082_005828 [Marasmius tenuissimus]